MIDEERTAEVEEFLAKRAKEVYAGLRRTAESGKQPSSSKPPYGYTVVRKDDVLCGRRPYSQLGKYLVLEDEARHVKRIFDEYLRTGSCVEVAALMTQLGTPTPDGREKWSCNTVLFILRNKCYIGQAVWGIVLIPCPPIVDPIVFEAVQVCLRSTASRLKPRSTSVVNLLDGCVYCGDCGARMGDGFYKASKTRQGGGYYACKHCTPIWIHNSPRPQWNTSPARAVEGEVRAAFAQMIAGEDSAFALEYIFTPGWGIPTWKRRQILLLSRLVVLVFWDPWRVQVKVGGEEATPEIEKLLLEIVEEKARQSGQSDMWVMMHEDAARRKVASCQSSVISDH